METLMPIPSDVDRWLLGAVQRSLALPMYRRKGCRDHATSE